jgi:hypothetical protein
MLPIVLHFLHPFVLRPLSELLEVHSSNRSLLAYSKLRVIDEAP